jgi:hypothetical protein
MGHFGGQRKWVLKIARKWWGFEENTRRPFLKALTSSNSRIEFELGFAQCLCSPSFYIFPGENGRWPTGVQTRIRLRAPTGRQRWLDPGEPSVQGSSQKCTKKKSLGIQGYPAAYFSSPALRTGESLKMFCFGIQNFPFTAKKTLKRAFLGQRQFSKRKDGASSRGLDPTQSQHKSKQNSARPRGGYEVEQNCRENRRLQNAVGCRNWVGWPYPNPITVCPGGGCPIS